MQQLAKNVPEDSQWLLADDIAKRVTTHKNITKRRKNTYTKPYTNPKNENRFSKPPLCENRYKGYQSQKYQKYKYTPKKVNHYQQRKKTQE